MQCMKTVYLTIDPGLRNTCAMLVEVRMDDQGVITAMPLWTNTYDLSGFINPMIERAAEMSKEIIDNMDVVKSEIEAIVVEFQPPIFISRNPAIVRWNSWIEAWVIASLRGYGKQIYYVHPNGMKLRFDIRGGDHALNKTLAKKRARDFLVKGSKIRQDHEADCLLMGIHQFMNANQLVLNK